MFIGVHLPIYSNKDSNCSTSIKSYFDILVWHPYVFTNRPSSDADLAAIGRRLTGGK